MTDSAENDVLFRICLQFRSGVLRFLHSGFQVRALQNLSVQRGLLRKRRTDCNGEAALVGNSAGGAGCVHRVTGEAKQCRVEGMGLLSGGLRAPSADDQLPSAKRVHNSGGGGCDYCGKPHQSDGSHAAVVKSFLRFSQPGNAGDWLDDGARVF